MKNTSWTKYPCTLELIGLRDIPARKDLLFDNHRSYLMMLFVSFKILTSKILRNIYRMSRESILINFSTKNHCQKMHSSLEARLSKMNLKTMKNPISLRMIYAMILRNVTKDFKIALYLSLKLELCLRMSHLHSL